ncbi:hypothetical protein FLAG1_00199 [Fusarium langsethiae]|uniref:Uncharacterized protein n=1 Tax=Fusarium langsethiae TaxID=179993 RepID=A0A0N0DIH6_FUSLA|nr:hypothetical protein FLAG1_00199 [Fusarium langsethiae]GKT97801.1 unnamed protein product [Fusarium langsethiae]
METSLHYNVTWVLQTNNSILPIKMCKKATCGTCNKTSWWGCGSHIPSVMDTIPDSDRCACEPKVEVGGVSYPPMAASPN